MDNKKIAQELVKVARELVGGKAELTIHDFPDREIEKVVRTKMRHFIEYVMDFYNDRDGIYPIDGLTDKDVIKATVAVLKDRNHSWGYGDSMDREAVRDVLLDKMGFTSDAL